MLTRLRIQGFKSLLDTEIELGSVNVFIGANGSGKSNLLEAVGMLSALASGAIEHEYLKYRGVRPCPPGSCLTAFADTHIESIRLEATRELMSYSVELAPGPNNSASWVVPKEVIAANGENLLSRDKEKLTLTYFNNGEKIQRHVDAGSDYQFLMNIALRAYGFTPFDEISHLGVNESQSKNIHALYANKAIAFLRELASYRIYCPTTLKLRDAEADISPVPVGLDGSGLAQAVQELRDEPNGKFGPFDIDDVYELLEWVDSISAEPTSNSRRSQPDPETGIALRFQDRFLKKGHQSISARESSEGALYILFQLVLVGHPKAPPIFAIDNFDQALHPRLACALTRLVVDQIVKDGNRQMLVTTHNPLVLDGLNLLEPRIRLFAVDRDAQGVTQVNRVQVTEELMAQADKGFSLSRLWVMGRLGGVPLWL